MGVLKVKVGGQYIAIPGIKGDKGDRGDPGPPNSLSIGPVTTGAPGSLAAAAVTGIAPTQVLNLTIPRGDKGDKGDQGNPGPANSLAIGTVTTGAPGSSASATITGTAPNQTLNLTLPRGEQGPIGSVTAHSHPVSDFTATGTRDGTTFLAGDNTWKTVSAAANVTRVVYTTTVPARPANATYVEWVGQVDPAANAQPGDTWVPTA